jgi:hypothetical protein
VRIPVAQLDPVSLQYLREIERTKGKGFYGVYAWQAPSRRPRPWWLLAVAFSFLVTTEWASLWLRVPVHEAARELALAWWRPAFVVLVTLVLIGGSCQLVRRRMRPALGAFLFVDARHAWEVSPDDVEVTALDGMVGVELYRRGARVSGVLMGQTLYEKIGSLYSIVVLKFPGGPYELVVREHEVADRLKRFLDHLILLRSEA